MPELLMNSEQATTHVVRLLEEIGIPYILVGAISSNAYGVARATNDADIVAAFDSAGLAELVRRLGPEFRLDRQMQIETITGSVRNVLTFLPTSCDIGFRRPKTSLFRNFDGLVAKISTMSKTSLQCLVIVSTGITSTNGRPDTVPASC